MAKHAIIHETVGITITYEDSPHALASQKVQYPGYKDTKRRAEARKSAVAYAITRALDPRSTIHIDWSTNTVFTTEDGWVRQVATFHTSQHKTEQGIEDAA